MCGDTTLISSSPRHTTMTIAQHANWISMDVQSLIEPPSIMLIKVKLEEERASIIIYVIMWKNPGLSMSYTYNINISMFEDVQPEYFLVLLKNLRIYVGVKGTA